MLSGGTLVDFLAPNCSFCCLASDLSISTRHRTRAFSRATPQCSSPKHATSQSAPHDSEGASSLQQQSRLPGGQQLSQLSGAAPRCSVLLRLQCNLISSSTSPGPQGPSHSSPPLVSSLLSRGGVLWAPPQRPAEQDPVGPGISPGRRSSATQAIHATSADLAQALPVLSRRRPICRDPARAPVGAPVSYQTGRPTAKPSAGHLRPQPPSSEA
ncbi:hypothetical protein NDU88_005527 [Pleurodeles waltl]|uniref:Uncharacterized protein n=1 Tax=Pleurodeles waltl TaxID=8319 RepID=A0AAV7LPT5_PLEWA|nr:hypothetical protein NDU88_005527 [Pleurodeles waltl]